MKVEEGRAFLNRGEGPLRWAMNSRYTLGQELVDNTNGRGLQQTA